MTFNVEKCGFRKLEHAFQSVEFYEMNNGPYVDGRANFLRLNVYLSRDDNFVSIWYGLLEPVIAEGRLESIETPKEFDLHSNYNQTLFRGYITSSEEAETIIRSLRISNYSPNVLSTDKENKLCCVQI